jgi:hypothetical protein
MVMVTLLSTRDIGRGWVRRARWYICSLFRHETIGAVSTVRPSAPGRKAGGGTADEQEEIRGVRFADGEAELLDAILRGYIKL